MIVRNIISPLVANVVEGHLEQLNAQLREVRSSFVAHGQYGSSRMALAAREASEASIKHIAESIVQVVKQVLDATRISATEESEAEAKDAYMFELSAAVTRVEALLKENSGQYFQPVSVSTSSADGKTGTDHGSCSNACLFCQKHSDTLVTPSPRRLPHVHYHHPETPG